jgi:hypothetical protein
VVTLIFKIKTLWYSFFNPNYALEIYYKLKLLQKQVLTTIFKIKILLYSFFNPNYALEIYYKLKLLQKQINCFLRCYFKNGIAFEDFYKLFFLVIPTQFVL